MTSSERTWLLSIQVTDLSVEKTLRVGGDQHVGGIMFKLVESLAVTADWSDHALWWPDKLLWLSKPKLTLNQYGVNAEAKLQFTPMHKTVQVQLPDLQLLDLKLDFSVSVFNAVMQLCKDMGIRHAAELSFLRPGHKQTEKEKKAFPALSESKSFKRSSRASSSSNGSLNKGPSSPASPFHTPQRNLIYMHSPTSTVPRTPQTPGSPGSWANGLSPASYSRSFDESLYNQLIHSPKTPTKEAFLYLNKYKSLLDKAAANGGWLDSNKSLMEQAVTENEVLHLKFKYYSFYDLNPRYDQVRINQIYEQAKWSLISEETECTEQEMLMFAALQLQVESQTSSAQDQVDSRIADEQDEIDAALTDLQVSLEGSSSGQNSGDITHVPELQEYIRHFVPKKHTMKGAKKYYAVLRDTNIYLHKSKEETNQNAVHHISLKDSVIQSEVNLSSQKFIIKLLIPTSSKLVEEWLRCDTEVQYARWMAACQLGSKGHTMADASYNAEVKNIEQFLNLQKPSSPVHTNKVKVNEESIDPANYVSPRFLKKNKSKVSQRIMEAHANVKDMSLMEAKLNYIKAWQGLPEYGLTYFLCKFRNCKKEEIVAIGFNRLIRINPKNCEVTRTYRFSTMSVWSVHWENQEVIVDFEEENLAIKPLSASCKVFHEFIGGYIFLSMRAQEKSQAINEDMFITLTSGTVS